MLSPSLFKEDAWHERIQKELQSGRPLFVSGTSPSGYGHAFIIDGYRFDGTTPYYHVNWGWDGYQNAYFLIDNMCPSEGGTGGSSENYSYDYELFFGIQPENGIDEIYVTIEYGRPIQKVATEVQENVRRSLETMTGLHVVRVDVHVQGVSFEKEMNALQAGAGKAVLESGNSGEKKAALTGKASAKAEAFWRKQNPFHVGGREFYLNLIVFKSLAGPNRFAGLTAPKPGHAGAAAVGIAAGVADECCKLLSDAPADS